MFKDRLKTLRKQKGVTQTELAAIIGVDASTVGHWEGKGNILPSDGIKEKLAEFFGVSIDYMMDREQIQTSSEYAITSDELELIEIYRNANATGKRMLSDFARMMIINPDFRQEAQEQSAI